MARLAIMPSLAFLFPNFAKKETMMMQFDPAAFLCDDLDVRPVGRATPLERCSGQICHIFTLVRLSRPEMTSIAVCGGITDGPEGKDFYAFDIYVFTAEGGFFLPTDEANSLFSTAGILYSRSLFIDLLGGWSLPADRTGTDEGIVGDAGVG